jgi:hypothetical protein
MNWTKTRVIVFILTQVLLFGLFIILIYWAEYNKPIKYNTYYVDGIPVVKCQREKQIIKDLDDQYGRTEIVGVVSHGYCPESDYDIAIGNSIRELYQRIKFLEKEVSELRGKSQ